MSQIPKSFYRVAFLEGLTLVLLLFIAVPLKHLGDQAILVRWLGPIHGLAFLFYQYTLLHLWSSGRCSRGDALKWACASFLPFGTFLALRKHTR